MTSEHDLGVCRARPAHRWLPECAEAPSLPTFPLGFHRLMWCFSICLRTEGGRLSRNILLSLRYLAFVRHR